MYASASLNARRRAAEMERLAGGEVVDVLVVGGGITGVGVALDAASRGLSVALVERRDLANGTSRWSSKLAHGGLRYLSKGRFGLAMESARERHILMSVTAPHLVRALPFVVPFDRGVSTGMALKAQVGVRMGNALRIAARTDSRLLPRPRRISPLEAQRLLPALSEDGLRGAVLYWDGQLEDDARLVVAAARTAAAHGAAILTYCAAAKLHRGGAECRDERSGASFTIRARHVVNATGVWAQTLSPDVQLSPSKGTHLIVPASRLGDPRASLSLLVGRVDRWAFALPMSDGRVLVGLTDEPFEGPIPDEPPVADDEEEFLLSTVSQALSCELTSDDVIGRFAGLRPLLAGRAGATADLSRKHALIEDPENGVLTLVGGKLTTYRRMAEDAVDRIASRPDVRAGRCRTATLPLTGAAPHSVLERIEAPARLVARYGAEAPAVEALAGGDRSLLEPIADGVAPLGVELLFGVEHEGAMGVDDLVDRRTRIGLVPAERARALPAAQALLDQREVIATVA
ncbi:MAG: glycerol-3-phosphate dehydrogenase/oxidase [Chloroflexi bacterium]|nr:MAG: glycerol-3-phosphate dehydrogenase/oxidase [Chloroflexota bacterium]